MLKASLHLFGKFDALSFFDSGVIDELSKDLDITVYADQKALDWISEFRPAYSTRVCKQELHPSERIYKIFSDALMIEYRNKCVTFRHKLRWTFIDKYGFLPKFKYRKILKETQSNRIRPRILVYKFIIFPFLFFDPIRKIILAFFNYILLHVFPNHINLLIPQLNKAAPLREFDVAIIPTRNLLFTPFILQAFYNSIHTRTVLIVSNWDNISTKPMPIVEFTALTCAGEQSKDHYKSIYGHQIDNVFPIGLPRFNNSSVFLTNVESSNSKNILYIGSGFPHNEFKLCVEISRMLENIFGYTDFTLHVKSHPEASLRLNDLSPLKAIRTTEGKVVPISEELNIIYKENPKEFFEHFQIAICGPTTMALEAVIHMKHCILDASALGYYPVEPYYALKMMMHLQGMRNLFGNQIGEDAIEIARLIDLIFQDKSRHLHTLPYSVNRFVDFSSKFSNELKKIIYEISK